MEAIEATPTSVAGSLPSQDVHVAAKQNPLNHWSVDKVKEWLEGIDPKIAKAAKAAGVNGRVLQELDAPAWTELGVTVALRRCQLVAAVKEAAEGRDVATIPFEDTTAEDTSAAAEDTSAAPEGERHRIQIRCAIQNLNAHDFAKSQTFEAYIKFEASWEDRSPILYEMLAAGYKLGDRIVKEKEKCTYNKFVILQHDGSEYSELFTPRITFMNRAKEPKTKEELYVAELPQIDSDSH
jgi:hypothetical protein